MSKNYKQLTEGIRSRINPENFEFKKAFSDELSTISYSDILSFIRVAMKGVEPEYTQKSKDAGEKVKEHLVNGKITASFRYQGSVMTDTHIKGYSDIDLLTICEDFYSYDRDRVKIILENAEERVRFSSSALTKLQNEADLTPYKGNSLEDLKRLRLNCESILSQTYSVYDITKPKSIKIKNLSLNREVDVVISNWYDDVSSIINDKTNYRGIQVYNKEKNNKEKADFPFLSIDRINQRSSDTKGRLKKMIRFLKNIKAGSEHEILLSSFDINAICYDIPTSDYQSLSFYELVPVIYNKLKILSTDQLKADNLVSVDGREYIFRNNSAKLDNLKKILGEVESLFLDLKKIILP